MCKAERAPARRVVEMLAMIVVALGGCVAPAAAQGPILDNRDGATPAGYTLVVDGSKITVPDGTARLALLIGNQSYDDAKIDPTRPLLAPLPKLTTACSDVKAIAQRLHDIGWRQNEILVLCNQSNAQTATAIGQFLSEQPLEPSHPKLMMIYLAGHGMQISGRNYFFGTDTLIDTEKTAKRAVASAGSDSTGKIFGPAEAVDVYSLLSRLEQERTLSFPFLVVIDACRDAPFLRFVDTSLPMYAGRADASFNLELVKKVISSPQAARNLPDGEEIVYGTQSGDTVLEQVTASRLADAVTKTLTANTLIRKQVIDVKKAVEKDNANLALRDRQYLSKEGDTYFGGDDWCFFGCPTSAHQKSGAVFLHAIRPKQPGYRSVAYMPQSEPGNAAGQRRPTPISSGATTLVGRFATTAPRKLLLDIFWCSAGDGGGARYDQAAEFASRLKAQLDVSNRILGASQIYAVRLREMTEADNEVPGFQKNIDALYVDPVQLEPDESRIANAYIKPLSPGIQTKATGVASKDYISVWFCKGAHPGPSAPTVYFQVATAKDLPTSSDLMGQVKRAVATVFVFSEAEIMLARKDAALIHYPPATVVRYSDPRLKDQADRVAGAVGAYLGKEVSVTCLYKCMRPEKSHNVEVWLGPGDRPAKLAEQEKLASTSIWMLDSSL